MHEQDEELLKKIKFSTWKKIIAIVLTNKRRLIWLVIFALILALLDAIIPLLNTYAIELFIVSEEVTQEMVNQNFNQYFVPFIIINIIIAVLFALVVYGFIKQGSIIEAEVNYDLRKKTFHTLQRLSFSFYDNTPQGMIMARMTSDARRLSEVISWGVVDLVWAALSMVFTLIVLYIHAWQLALIVTISLPLMFLITFLFRKKVLTAHRKSRYYNSELTAQYNESFLGAKTTKSLVIETDRLDEFTKTAKTMRRSSVHAVVLSAMFSNVLLAVCYIVVGVTMVSGTYLATLPTAIISIPVLYLFIRSAMNFFEPVMSLTNFVSQLQQAQASAERVIELMETKPEIEDSSLVTEKYGTLFEQRTENWEDMKGDIEFRDVTFYYKENEMILEHFNLKIKAGSKVAFVGHTGSGKTTLVNLISRFYEPKKGQILVDGRDYKERSLSWLHKRLGYVLQTPHLFSTTIMENIRYGRLSATDEEIIQASKEIGIHEFISKLDKGYQTEVGEGGNLLSLGQKQLISFARALIADPRILILDEATSSIDSQAEKMIQDATSRLLKDRTSLMVAHRLSTIVDADLIVLMSMGKIVEQGTHQELLEKRGAYFELYKNQFMQQKEEIYIKETLGS